MNMLPIANNLSSCVVILACWWLAHINARANPPGRAIAAGYSLLGISVLFTAAVRNLSIGAGDTLAWLAVISKSLLAITLILTIYRRFRLGDR